MIQEKLRVPCIVRSMSNTPATIGMGMTVWTKTSNCSSKQHSQTTSGYLCDKITDDTPNVAEVLSESQDSNPVDFVDAEKVLLSDADPRY